MAKYKALVTISWEFESDQPSQDCLDSVRAEAKKIIDHDLVKEFSKYDYRVDISRMKDFTDHPRLINVAEFPVDEILNQLITEPDRKRFVVNGQSYNVRMNSDRLWLFKENRSCVVCGLTGTKMILNVDPKAHKNVNSAHFNMYAEQDGKLVLMTKDHILPKSKGGPNCSTNYRTMCSTCNGLRGNDDLTLEQIKNLNHQLANPEKLSVNELRKKLDDLRTTYIIANAVTVITV